MPFVRLWKMEVTVEGSGRGSNFVQVTSNIRVSFLSLYVITGQTLSSQCKLSYALKEPISTLRKIVIP